MTPIQKAIIPVAGYGTRVLPVTKAMPKEMLPIVDTPVIQYIVEEAVRSGITDIIFVTGRGKRAIEDHFDTSFELEQTLVEHEKRDLLALVQSVSRLARFVYVRQPMPRGDGDAILRAAHLIAPDEPFAVLFGDDLIDATKPALAELAATFARTGAPTVALTRVPRRDLHHYGAVIGHETRSGIWAIERFVEKPRDTRGIKVPLAVIGRYILTPAILGEIALARRNNRGHGELRIADGIARYVAKGRSAYGVEVKGTRYDCGSRVGYLQANIAFARKRPELRRELAKFLKRNR